MSQLEESVGLFKSVRKSYSNSPVSVHSNISPDRFSPVRVDAENSELLTPMLNLEIVNSKLANAPNTYVFNHKTVIDNAFIAEELSQVIVPNILEEDTYTAEFLEGSLIGCPKAKRGTVEWLNYMARFPAYIKKTEKAILKLDPINDFLEVDNLTVNLEQSFSIFKYILAQEVLLNHTLSPNTLNR